MLKKFIFSLAMIAVATTPAMAQNMVMAEEVIEAEEPDMVAAPDFTLKNLEGNNVSLNEFQGSWVVLDFWGSWCKWCIKGIPEMKAAYEAYKDLGFEIIGIDCGDTVETWKGAVERYGLPWVNVYNPEGSPLLKEYGVQGFPTKVIINPEGYIYDIVVGEDPEFYNILKNLFF